MDKNIDAQGKKMVPVVLLFKSPKMRGAHRQILKYKFLESQGGIVVETPIYQN